jgi:hypothetical protein
MWSKLNDNTSVYAIPLLHLDSSGGSLSGRTLTVYTIVPGQYPVLLEGYGFTSSVKIKVLDERT